MPLLKQMMTAIKFFCVMGIFLSLGFNAKASNHFRTPAKRYGSAYSIKITIWRGGFSYVIPVWVRPDQKESTLDRGQMAFMGWTFPDLNAEEVEASGGSLPIKNFKAGRSDWAVTPEYPRNCCMGVLGQDLLNQYQLRFDPRAPAHIEWTRVEASEKPKAVKLETQLKSLFSIHTETAKVGSELYDLSSTPYTLSLSEGALTFEKDTNSVLKGLARAIIGFEVIPGGRNLKVVSILGGRREVAKNQGLKIGSVISELNGEPVSELARFEIEGLLRGKKSNRLEIVFSPDREKEEKLKLTFDFEKNEFIAPGAVPSHSGRN